MTFDGQSAFSFGGLITAGINGGVFFAFSTFVMPALAVLPARQGVSSMQAINRAAPNPAFMVTLFGAVLVGLPLAVGAVADLGGPGAGYRLAAVLLSGATLAITIAFHVPRNNALAALDPSTASSASAWTRYLVTWTRGTHVRTVTSIASAGCYALALHSL